ERAATQREIDSLGIKCRGTDQPIGQLSGGNQQKVVLGRWLLTQPKVLILDEPTRGVDIGAKTEIHRLLAQLADAGTAIVLISSDGPEGWKPWARWGVFCRARVAGGFSPAEATPETIATAALPDEATATGQTARPAPARSSSWWWRSELALAAALVIMCVV